MKRNYLNSWIIGGGLPLVVACWAGCDDDDKGEKNESNTKADAGDIEAGKSGSAGKGAGSAGKPAMAGRGGSGDKAGTEGSAGKTSTAGSAAAGSGGGAGSAGAAGSGGAAGGAPIDYPDLSNAKGTLFSKVNALNAVAFASDGKIYVAGEINVVDAAKSTGDTEADKYRTSVVGHKIAVMRLLPSGAVDESFGDKGTVIWEGPDGEASTLGVVETNDGSVVVDVNVRYASKRTGVALVKFDATGKLVTTFGDNGRKDLVFGWTDADVKDYPPAMDGKVQYPSEQSWDIKASDGGAKLVVFAHGPAAHGSLDMGATPAVQRTDNDRYIVRVNAADGAIDAAFNGGKIVAVDTPNVGAAVDKPRFVSDGGRHGMIEPDGAIVSAGYTNYNDDKGNQIVLIRLKADGSFDEAFHKERTGQPVLPGVAVFNPVPDADKGFAECYGVAHTPKGYVTTGYGRAFGAMEGISSLGYLPSTAVDMVSTRFTGTAVDTSYGRTGLLAAQSEPLGNQGVSIFEDRGRSSVYAISGNRILMAGRFGQYPAVFVVTEAGQFDAAIAGKRPDTKGMFLYPTLTSTKQPATSMFQGLAVSADGKHIVAGAANHEQGALIGVLEIKDDGSIVPVSAN